VQIQHKRRKEVRKIERREGEPKLEIDTRALLRGLIKAKECELGCSKTKVWLRSLARFCYKVNFGAREQGWPIIYYWVNKGGELIIPEEFLYLLV